MKCCLQQSSGGGGGWYAIWNLHVGLWIRAKCQTSKLLLFSLSPGLLRGVWLWCFLPSCARYHLKDVIVGKIYFLLVRIKIKHMEIDIIKRETTGTGPNVYHENDTIAKYEIMDGAPVRGEKADETLQNSSSEVFWGGNMSPEVSSAASVCSVVVCILFHWWTQGSLNRWLNMIPFLLWYDEGELRHHELQWLNSFDEALAEAGIDVNSLLAWATSWHCCNLKQKDGVLALWQSPVPLVFQFYCPAESPARENVTLLIFFLQCCLDAGHKWVLCCWSGDGIAVSKGRIWLWTVHADFLKGVEVF